MAPQVGFEPTTNRLTADCSTTELLRSVPEEHSSTQQAHCSIPNGGPTRRSRKLAPNKRLDQMTFELVDPGQKIQPETTGVGHYETLQYFAGEHCKNESPKGELGAASRDSD